MKRLLLVIFSVLLLSNAFLQPVSAHVLITDQTTTKGAILHVMPDDDPIAGQDTVFYFDTQNQLAAQGSNVKLDILDENGSSKEVEAKVDGSLATATYIFPTQGIYKLTFTVNSNGQTYIFEQSQRVSRGVSASALSKPTYAWAEMLLVTCFVLFALLVVMFINRRKDIATQSKW